ncbi:uroporphyrinogen-III C-methyltransferase [Marivivens donghaensis]|uniref:Uroporphyrinogen-III C-methyltransferase n=1 Tax=Marivivens donghaensis TaxID=1699413 RepID=A0ABX0VYW3_9RHOB|nr:siroheme synthase CysG [Marivivens donghaensis]NIY72948.1 uroporphyrinogen-III C-methyltransferase [Marivivens donghaensis]
MQHFPIFLSVKDQTIVLVGGGEAALAKLRLLTKTEARIVVYATEPHADLVRLDAEGKIKLVNREFDYGDARGARRVYAATEDELIDARIVAIAHDDGVLANVVDNLALSDFITPAIVDRDPVTVAIGTEGAAPVLARAIKADLEERLPSNLGMLARLGKAFRHAADALPMGRKRRDFWADYYFNEGPHVAARGEDAVNDTLGALLDKHIMSGEEAGRVDLVGAGPGDPELLTLKARKALDKADVVIYDRLVAPEILELARREAIMINAGKEGFGASTAQDDINAMIVEHALDGHHVVRLKAGDPTVFGRLDEEIEAIEAAGIAYAIVPGITAASAAVAQIGQSLTKRERNASVRLLTGHDMKGFCDHDWRTLARDGEVAAIYMGKRAARFVQGRLLMHGASPETPVTIIENASRADSRVIATTLGELEPTMTTADLKGPAITFYGLAPRHAAKAIQSISRKEASQ